MRLAVFTNQFPIRSSTFFGRDMRGLINAGIDIDVFSFYPDNQSLWQYVPEILNESVLPRNKVHHISLGRSFRFVRLGCLNNVGRILLDASAIIASAARFGIQPICKSAYVFPKALAWAHLFADRYDHILGYWGNYAGTCAYVFHRLLNRSIPLSLFLHAGADLYKDQVYLEQKFLYADNIVTCSEFNRKYIRDHFGNVFQRISHKIYVHHHGIEFSQIAGEVDNRPSRKIIAVGVLEKYKGYDYLLRAARDLSDKGISYEVEFVGDGKEAESLKALAIELQIAERVKFRGWIPPEKVPNAMRQSTLLVHPSQGLGDGVPNVIKEAMGVYTPVVASEVAGIPELLDGGRCGILVPPGNVKALSRGLELMLSNESLRRSYADSARKYAETKFDLWRNGQRLADILRSTKRLNHSKAAS